jgi:hypothetical protein
VVSTAFIRDFLIGEADIASFSCYSKPPASAGGAFTHITHLEPCCLLCCQIAKDEWQVITTCLRLGAPFFRKKCENEGKNAEIAVKKRGKFSKIDANDANIRCEAELLTRA